MAIVLDTPAAGCEGDEFDTGWPRGERRLPLVIISLVEAVREEVDVEVEVEVEVEVMADIGVTEDTTDRKADGVWEGMDDPE